MAAAVAVLLTATAAAAAALVAVAAALFDCFMLLDARDDGGHLQSLSFLIYFGGNSRFAYPIRGLSGGSFSFFGRS